MIAALTAIASLTTAIKICAKIRRSATTTPMECTAMATLARQMLSASPASAAQMSALSIFLTATIQCKAGTVTSTLAPVASTATHITAWTASAPHTQTNVIMIPQASIVLGTLAFRAESASHTSAWMPPAWSSLKNAITKSMGSTAMISHAFKTETAIVTFARKISANLTLLAVTMILIDSTVIATLAQSTLSATPPSVMASSIALISPAPATTRPKATIA